MSFGSAAGLVSLGAYTLRTALRKARWFWPFAIVPALFGLQQASEGFVWVGLEHHDSRLVRSAATIYLFFALAFWPTWFSLSAALIEPWQWKRRALYLWTAASTFWYLAVFLPAIGRLDQSKVHVVGHSIRYEMIDHGAPAMEPLDVWAQRLLYAMTVTIPILASTVRRVLFVPVFLSLAAGAAAAIFVDRSFTSVWCLWSAVASATVVYSVWVAPSDPKTA